MSQLCFLHLKKTKQTRTVDNKVASMDIENSYYAIMRNSCHAMYTKVNQSNTGRPISDQQYILLKNPVN